MMVRLLLFLLAFPVLQGPGQPAAAEAAGNNEIRGRITDEESGLPLARATIRLTRRGSPDQLTMPTDDAGLYRFAGLAAGEYDGLVQAGDFRETHLTRSLATASGSYRPIVLKDREVREIHVALPRARAMNVRVVDPWGDPLSGLRVIAKSATGDNVSPLPFMQSTDDHGRIRIFGLQSGRYIVCAEADPLGFSDPPGSDGRREGLLRTCYPSAADEAEAEFVRLDRADVPELEIQMRRGRTFGISGRILDASGAPASGAFASLEHFQSNGSAGRGIKIDAEGRFSLANVQPGVYAIEASIGGPDRPEHRRPLEVGFVMVRVDASDVENLLVSMERGVDVAGRITLEDPTAPVPASPGSGLMVSTRLAGDRVPGSGSMRTALVRENKLFTLEGIFGSRTVDVVNVPRGWYVKSIRYRGTEIIDHATEFKGSSDPSLLEVVLSNRGAVITGRATDDMGEPAGRALVMIFRDDGGGSDVRLTSRAVASSTGAFQIGPVRSGDYLIVALPSGAPMVQPGAWDRVARLATVAQRITLGDLEARTLDLRVVNER
jgi:hypothetical protein